MPAQHSGLRAAIVPLLGLLFLLAVPISAAGQDHSRHDHGGHDQGGQGHHARSHSAPAHLQGRHGVGHDKWHEQFYSKLVRKDTKMSCCNLADCSPTTSRMVEGGYEVLVEGEWTHVPQNVIQNVTAPDGGAHVCFPKQPSYTFPKGTLFCVVLPPET